MYTQICHEFLGEERLLNRLTFQPWWAIPRDHMLLKGSPEPSLTLRKRTEEVVELLHVILSGFEQLRIEFRKQSRDCNVKLR